MRASEYKHLYVLKNKASGNFILYYWASSQKHKALFSSQKKAEEALRWLNEDCYIEIVEL
jgi:hypothetical protein